MIHAHLHRLGHEIFPLPVIPVQKFNQTRFILITCKNYHRSIAAINKLPRRRRGWMNLFTLAAYTADMMIWLSYKCIKLRRLKIKKKNILQWDDRVKIEDDCQWTRRWAEVRAAQKHKHARIPAHTRKKHARWKFSESLSLIGGVIAACLRNCEIEQKFHSI